MRWVPPGSGRGPDAVARLNPADVRVGGVPRPHQTAMYPMAFVEPAALDVNFPEYTRNVQVLVDA